MKKLRIGLVTRREMKGYVFLLPWLVGFVTFFLVPLVQSVWYSWHDVKVTATGLKMTWVGWENYRYIFQQDTVFTEQLTNFFTDSVLRLAVILVFSLVIAMMLNQPLKGKGVFRTLFFLPIIVVSGPVLERLVNEGATAVPLIESYGVNGIVEAMLPPMLARPLSSLFSQIILVLWYSGVPILIYMTGLQKIDSTLYEASMIDGANGWISFWKITLPALRPMILINGVYTLVFLATTGLNEVMATINDRMFRSGEPGGGYGIASSMAWVYALSLGLALIVLLLITKERKGKQIAIQKTGEQIAIERMHAERARNMKRKGGKKHGR
ncbi:MAG: sugar ABC transporter permease [Clostridia bacterium]|nr:sugar ABC transporter permease [Clostridia bacterium]MBQ3484656.1 sugar ABC transporter permease [Clostridia bacterium]